MGKFFKRGLALILTFMLVLAVAPSSYAYASNNEQITKTYVNPMYEGKNVKCYPGSSSTTPSAAPTFNTLAEAGNYFKEQMVLREGTISFTVNIPYYEGIHNDIFDEAVKDNGFSEPLAGDYLYANFHSYICNMSSGYYSTTLTYTVTYLTTYYQEQMVKYEIKRVLDNLNVYNSDEYTKVKAVHDYIVTNIDYDYSLERHSSYDAIVEKNVVCQGFASITSRMLKELNIGARYIIGNSSTHAWNIVKLGSSWYNTDNTWDENLTTGSNICYDYFLRGSLDFFDHTRDANYNTTQFKEDFPTAYLKYTQPSAQSTLNIANYNYPTTLEEGSPFVLKGTISSNYKITYVKVQVLDKYANPVSTASKTVYPNAYSFSDIDSGIKFGTLPAGTYTYQVIAKDESGTQKTLVDKKFTVTPVEVIATGVTTNSLNVRTGPSTAYPSLGKLAYGTKVDIVAKDSATGWFKIKYNGGYGYVSYKYLKVTYLDDNNNNEPTDEVIATGVTTNSLNVRTGPSTSYSSIGKLAYGTKVDIVAKDSSTGWFKIKYGSGYGYVSYKYLNVTYLDGGASEVIATGVTTNSLNVRTGPSTSYTSIGKLAYGTKIEIVAKDSATGWYKIKYGSGYGYVSYKYVKIT